MTRQQILAAAVLAVGGIGLTAGSTFAQAQADGQQQRQAGQFGQAQQPAAGQDATAQPGARPAGERPAGGQLAVPSEIPNLTDHAQPAGAGAQAQAGQSQVREVLARTTNAVLSEGGIGQLTEQLAQDDQQRFADLGKESQQLDQSVKALRQAYKEKYQKDLDITQASEQIFTADFFRVGGRSDAAQQAGARFGGEPTGQRTASDIALPDNAGGAVAADGTSTGIGAGLSGAGASGNASKTTGALSGAPQAAGTSGASGQATDAAARAGQSAADSSVNAGATGVGAGATGVGASGNVSQTTGALGGVHDSAAGAAGHAGADGFGGRPLADSAVTAGASSGHNLNVIIPESHGMPQARLNLVNESGTWKIDLPQGTDAKQFCQKLEQHLSQATQMKDQWPADANEAAKAITHHALLAFSADAARAGAEPARTDGRVDPQLRYQAPAGAPDGANAGTGAGSAPQAQPQR